MSTFEHYVLWTALPYVCLIGLVVGLVWRYRTDQFGWTSRSSQWQESRILRWSSPLFHVGFLMVAAGHLVGLCVPSSWTQAVGISQHAYHLAATGMGSLAAAMVLVGVVGLLYRRIVVRSVRLATTTNDKLMYVLLLVPVLLGTYATVLNQILTPRGYDYRQTISPWFRSVFTLSPRPELMADVPLSFKLHIVAGLLLLAVWPFTRLVHVVSAPVGYATRPYVVYRSRPGTVAPTPPRRGWAPVSLQGTGNQGPGDTAPAEGA